MPNLRDSIYLLLEGKVSFCIKDTKCNKLPYAKSLNQRTWNSARLFSGCYIGYRKLLNSQDQSPFSTNLQK